MSRRMRRMEARVKMWVLVSSTPGGPLTCVELGILEILEILEILGILARVRDTMSGVWQTREQSHRPGITCIKEGSTLELSPGVRSVRIHAGLINADKILDSDCSLQGRLLSKLQT